MAGQVKIGGGGSVQVQVTSDNAPTVSDGVYTFTFSGDNPAAFNVVYPNQPGGNQPVNPGSPRRSPGSGQFRSNVEVSWED